ncbi:hypothetical protein WJX79_006895 [Trebouxia sp. C0005]
MSQLIANACRKRRASKLPASVVIFVTYFSILQLVMCKAPTTGAREHQRHRRLVEASPSKSFILPAMMLATVFDSGLQPHPGRAHLDTGNSSCTLITSRFAKQLGLVNFDCRPTQAYSGTIRVSGIVHGMHIDLPIINIQYEIQGQKIYSRAGLSDQSSHNSWTYSSPAMRSDGPCQQRKGLSQNYLGLKIIGFKPFERNSSGPPP